MPIFVANSGGNGEKYPKSSEIIASSHQIKSDHGPYSDGGYDAGTTTCTVYYPAQNSTFSKDVILIVGGGGHGNDGSDSPVVTVQTGTVETLYEKNARGGGYGRTSILLTVLKCSAGSRVRVKTSGDGAYMGAAVTGCYYEI